MSSIKYKIGALGVLLFTALIILNASAGEMLDWLPEIQYERSMKYIFEFITHSSRSHCSGDPSEVTNLEANLLMDSNGKPRSEEAILNVISNAACAFIVIARSASPTEGFVDIIFDITSGKPMRLSDSFTYDGTKQSLRVYASLLLFFAIQVDTLGTPFDNSHILGNDPCAKRRSWATTGETFELQMAAFWSLQLRKEIEGDRSGLVNRGESCVQDRKVDEQTLITQAKAGDLDAAVNLANLWNNRIPAMNAGTIQQTITSDENHILQDTVIYPDLAKAYTLALIYLNVSPFFPHGL